VADNTALDYETTVSFALTITVDDGRGEQGSATVTVNLNDLDENHAPVIADQSFGIDENSLGGASVGMVLASDADGDVLNYAITAGNSSGTFAIGTTTGELTVADNTALDYETTVSFTLTITVDDGRGKQGFATVTVNLNNLDENHAPVIADQSFSIDENSLNGTSIGMVVASDADGDVLNYAITAGNSSGTFAISTSTGELTVADNTALDYETTVSFALTITVDDGRGEQGSATVHVNIIDLEDTSVLGTRQAQPSNSILIPNPAKADLTVKNDGELIQKVYIVELSGRIIKEVIANTHQTVISVSDLTPGIYMLLVTTQSGTRSNRFIKE